MFVYNASMAGKPRGNQKRETVCVTLESDLAEQLSAAAFALKTTKSAIVESALKKELSLLETERGSPFPSRD